MKSLMKELWSVPLRSLQLLWISPPNKRSHAWDEKDLLAQSEIIWSYERDVQCLLSRCSTARDCWDALRPFGITLKFITWWMILILPPNSRPSLASNLSTVLLAL